MDIEKICESTVNLLVNLDKQDREIYSDLITINFIRLVQKNNFKKILFVYNSLNEPNIDGMIRYCLNHDIECYVNYHTKNHVIRHLKIEDINFEKEFIYYTVQPYVKDKKLLVKGIKFDLVVFPILAFDANNNCIDYHVQLNYVTLLNINDSTKTCAYAYNFQEYNNIEKQNKVFKTNFIITNDKIWD